ncbi:hypothetical protein RvY_02594 [Ramazzottius varieornatus]|uniref:NADP-dependent oxidoreductase domain-containing protein n=1 Tax=Ramazzottius varieornatus TaxID=947166 RepID=A0A1D1UNM3_RAMVA|nr:hypothetical protein RvY_02594 [Ramazzottius varieornatus]
MPGTTNVNLLFTTLPGTDLSVSRVCLGTWQFNGGQADITWSGQEEKLSKAIVDKALETGVNFFDTAEAYKNSEVVLGKALEGRRQNAVIASKFGQNHPEGKVEYSAMDIENALTQSLTKLNTTYIDLYQVHWPICVANMEETVQQLKLEQSRGRILHYGYCNFGVENMKAFQLAGGKPVTTQMPYNLLWRAIEHSTLPLIRENNLSVLAYSALQQGLLTGKFHNAQEVPEGRRRTRLFNSQSTTLAKHGQPGMETETFQAIGEIRKISEELGESMSTVALSWLLAQKNVESVIVGCSSVQQVGENCRVVPLKPAIIERLNSATDQVKNLLGDNADLWAAESRMK